MTDAIIAVTIYALALVWLVAFSLKFKPVGDELREYQCYQSICKTGKMSIEEHILLSSCPLATYLPYLVNKVLKTDALKIYSIMPCIWFAMMPMFGYLTARLYLSIPLSVLTVLFICSNFQFCFYPANGRNSIAVGILAGLIYGLLAGNLWLAVVFVVLLVVAHYGTAHFTLYVLGMSWLIMTVTGNEYRGLSTALIFLLAGIWIWFNFISKGAGSVIKGFIKNTVNGRSPIIQKQQAAVKPVNPYLSFETRDAVVSSAAGRNWQLMSAPQRIEFIASWLVVIILSVGAVVAVIEHGGLFRLLIITGYSAILIAIAVPHVSVYYGVVRTYFTALTILAPCFIIGAAAITQAIGISVYWLAIPIIGVYGLQVSGIGYKMFRIDKQARIKNSLAQYWSGG